MSAHDKHHQREADIREQLKGWVGVVDDAKTGHAQARAAHAAQAGREPDAEFDLRTDFFHDVPPQVTDEALAAGGSAPPSTLFAQPWPLRSWPDVPTRFLQSRDDRFFPVEFQRRVVGERPRGGE